MRWPAVLLLLLLALSGCGEPAKDPADGPDDPTGTQDPTSSTGTGTSSSSSSSGQRASSTSPSTSSTLTSSSSPASSSPTSSSSSSPSTSSTTSPSSPPPKRDPVTWDITISGNAFVDGSITVQAGDTVRWTHADGLTPHTVTSDDGQAESFDSHADCVTLVGLGCMVLGATFSHTFPAAGTTAYHCKVHPAITGTITVLDRYDAVP